MTRRRNRKSEEETGGETGEEIGGQTRVETGEVEEAQFTYSANADSAQPVRHNTTHNLKNIWLGILIKV